MGMGFTARCWTRTNDSNTVYAAIRVSDEQQMLLRRHPNRDEPMLVYRVIRIIEGFSERLQENRLRLIE
jgi:hypothetical protein